MYPELPQCKTMNNQEITAKYYKEAVQGLDEKTVQDNELWYTYVTNFPRHLQVIYTVIVFHNQVFNGGLHQYFFNSFGQFAFLTIQNLKLVKAYKAVEILEQALKIVNIDNEGVDGFREKIYNRKLAHLVNFDDKVFSSLHDLDTKYYALEDNENLEQLLVEYLGATHGYFPPGI